MDKDEGWKPEDRFLYLTGEMNDEQTHAILQRVLQHWDREFLLVINSDGGSSFHAVCLVNLLRQHGRIDTLCMGVALSAAADCLAAGRRRYIVPGAIAMLHQVSWELGREFAANLLKNATFLQRLNDMLTEGLSQATGKKPEELDRDMATDYYLVGQEIIDYGLADAFWDPAVLLHQPPKREGRLRSEHREPRKRRSPDSEAG